MNLLCAGAAPFSYGEIALLVNFASRLARRHRVRFLVPESHASVVEGAGLTCLKAGIGPSAVAKIQEFLDSDGESAVLIPDFLSLWYLSAIYGLTPQHWRKVACPVVSLNSHGWNRCPATMDVAGEAIDPTGLGEGFAGEAEFIRAIVPVCPFHPLEVDDPRLAISMYPIDTQPTRRPALDAFRDSPEEKVILLVGLLNPAKCFGPSTSRILFRAQRCDDSIMVLLQTLTRLKASGALDTMMALPKVVPLLLNHYLESCGHRLHVVTVSHFLDQPGDSLPQGNGRVRWTSLRMMAERDYDRLVAGADLMISLNEVSGALVKGMMAGTPTLALINSHASLTAPAVDLQGVPEETLRALLSLKCLYPWRYYPIGLHSYYQGLLRENPYRSTYRRRELFESDRVIATIDRLLSDRGAMQEVRDRQADYRAKLAALSGPEQVMSRLTSALSA